MEVAKVIVGEGNDYGDVLIGDMIGFHEGNFGEERNSNEEDIW